MTSKSKFSILPLLLVAVVALVIGVSVQQREPAPIEPSELATTIILPTAKPLHGIAFSDHRGAPFGAEQLQGHWTLLFPGFTHCPDICPTTLQTLKLVKQQLQAKSQWGNYQVVMMTVDPERDNSERLSHYVPHFDTEFIGITASIEATQRFTKQVGVLFFKQESEAPENYEVDHSASIILINSKVEWAGAITAPFAADTIAADLSRLAEFYEDDHRNIAKTTSNVTLTPSPASEQKIHSASTDLSMHDAWARPAPPTTKNTAAYFKLMNNSDSYLKIVGAQSPQFNSVMIHQTRIEDGIAKMVHQSGVTIPANEGVEFAPMGTHLMLTGATIPLLAGEKIDIELIIESGDNFVQQIEIGDPVQGQVVEGTRK